MKVEIFDKDFQTQTHTRIDKVLTDPGNGEDSWESYDLDGKVLLLINMNNCVAVRLEDES